MVRSLFQILHSSLSVFFVIHILASALLGRVMQVSASPETIQRGEERHSGLNQVQSAWRDQMTMRSSTTALMDGRE